MIPEWFIWLQRSNKNNRRNWQEKGINLSRACIDYRKVFDSFLHTTILKALEMYKDSLMIVNLPKYTMELWKTKSTAA